MGSDGVRLKSVSNYQGCNCRVIVSQVLHV